MTHLATAFRRILNRTSLMLVFCILVTHKHTTKCQTQFRPIKPHLQQRGLLTQTARLATFVQQPQFRHHSSLHSSIISRREQQPTIKPLYWPQYNNAGAQAPGLLRPPFQVQQQPQTLLNNFKTTNQIMSDRRTSSSQPAGNSGNFVAATDPNKQLDVNYRQAQASGEQQVPIRSSGTVIHDNSLQNKQHHWHEHNGKLLICYYATKQTAPYWPKDSREFIVPASRLDQAATEFLKINNLAELTNKPGHAQLSSQPVGHQHNRQQRNGPFVINQNDNSLSNGPNQMSQPSQFLGHQQHPQSSSIFADAGGGRMVVIAPKFVPFNQSSETNSKSNNMMNHNEIAIDRPDSLAQMFFIANNRRKTIADRQDNGATITSTTTTTTSSSAKNQSNAKQQSTPQMAEFIVPNNDRASSNEYNNSDGVAFGQNRSKHDLDNKHNVGGQMSNFEEGRIASLKQLATSATTISTPTLRLPFVNGQGPLVAPMQLSPTFHIDNERAFNVNNRDNLERNVQARQQQLLPSPSMSRAFVVGTTLATSSPPVAPLSAPSHNSNNNNNNVNNANKPDHGTVFVQSGPPSANSDHNNFYYYYNLPNNNNNNNNPPSQTTSPSASSGSITPTTISLGSSPASQSAYRPASLDQQQHHELSGTTLAGFNNNGNPHRGKSLQIAGSDQELVQPVATGSANSLPAVTQFPASTSSQTSYLINSSSKNQPLDRLIVSNGPSSSPPVSTVDRQRYSIQTISTPDSPDDIFKGYTTSNEDGKTTPIVHSHLGPLQTLSQTPTTRRPYHIPPITSSSFASSGGGGLMSKADETSGSTINRNHHANHHVNKQTVGLGGNSLSAALVSSPLSTMFDVFGAASQYLMRFKPSSLISPASFAAFNSIGSDQNSHNKLRANVSSLSSVASLVSLPFASHGHNSNPKTPLSSTGDRGSMNNSSGIGNSPAGSFLTRLSLQNNQRREDICGRTIQMPERRIIGGEGAKYGEFPYQVHIKIAKHQCGGALIDKQSIVTAAHCVYHFITRAPVNKLQIVIGAYDIEDEQYQELPPQYFKVNKVKLHPNFRFSASHPDRYDIAILKLDKPVEYTDNVLPVCLPGKDLRYDNMVGTVTGFGKTDPSLSNRYGTRLLQKVDVPIIENGECERWHRTRGIDLKIFPEMMCAGYEDGLKDACVGDSGGPLVVKTPVGSHGAFRWTLAGITSAGFGCAQSRQPGIYHRVSHTVDWILENLD